MAQKYTYFAAHRLKVLGVVVKSYMDIATRNRRGGHLSWNAWLGSQAGMESLKDGHGDVAKLSGETPLHWAAYLGLREMVRVLVESKSNIELKNHAGETALHLAAQNGEQEVVKVLLEAQANLAVEDKEQRNALHHASLNGRVEVVKLLLEFHKDLVMRADGLGLTPHERAS